MIAAIIWIVLIYLISFWKSGPFGWLFLLIPLIIYGINLSNVTKHTVELENEMFQGYPDNHVYESVDGVGFLLLALMFVESRRAIAIHGFGF